MKKEILVFYLPAILACFLWGTANPIVKYGLQYDTPLSFAGKRFIIAGIVLMITYGDFKKYFFYIINYFRKILFLAFFSTVVSSSLFYISADMLSGSLASIIIGSQPIIISVMSHFFGVNDRMNGIKLFSFIFGFSGVIIVSFTKDTSTEYSILGILLLIIVNIFQGISNIYLARDKTDIPSHIITSGQTFLGGVIIVILSFLFEKPKDLEDIPVSYYFSLGWLSLVSSTAITIWFNLIKEKQIPVSKVNIWKFLIPVIGVLFSSILLGDKITYELMTGMIIIVISIIILGISSIKRV